MYHHRLVISYKSTNYFGWQDLGAGEQKPTVHAQGQVVKITIAMYIVYIGSI